MSQPLSAIPGNQLTADKHRVVEFVGRHFKDNWRSEADCSFSQLPVNCFIAVKDKELIGFACHDAVVKNFFGPTGFLAPTATREIEYKPQTA